MSGIEDAESLVGVAEWYAGKNIFVTGSTGFMGKILVEKLLRDCPDLNRLYLLIRKKKGVEPAQRKEEYIGSVVFDLIRKNNAKQFEKLYLIKGDVLEENLGISEEDRNELKENVNVVFHCAANVRFDQLIRPAVEINTMGTQKVLQLAEEMKSLKVFVHVSTSFCQCNEDVLEERAYPPPNNPIGIMHMVKSLDDNILEKVTPRILKGLPNTYAYTKALTEGLIATYEEKLPIIVCRPSIVSAVIKEPLPGWVEGTNGPTGLMVGAARGVIRTMLCNADYPADLIPVDTAINALIVAAWDRAQKNDKKVDFMNVCLPRKILATWGETIENGKRIFYDNPLCFSLWYPNGSIKSNYYHHMLAVLLFHYLPAYFVDSILVLIGQKPFLVRVQKKISLGLRVLQYYTTRAWVFKTDKLENLYRKLLPRDRDRFDMALDQLNWEHYWLDMTLGLRTYVLNEGPETLPRARKVLRRLYILDRVVTYAMYGLIFWFLFNYLETILSTIGNVFNFCIGHKVSV